MPDKAPATIAGFMLGFGFWGASGAAVGLAIGYFIDTFLQ